MDARYPVLLRRLSHPADFSKLRPHAVAVDDVILTAPSATLSIFRSKVLTPSLVPPPVTAPPLSVTNPTIISTGLTSMSSTSESVATSSPQSTPSFSSTETSSTETSAQSPSTSDSTPSQTNPPTDTITSVSQSATSTQTYASAPTGVSTSSASILPSPSTGSSSTSASVQPSAIPLPISNATSSRRLSGGIIGAIVAIIIVIILALIAVCVRRRVLRKRLQRRNSWAAVMFPKGDLHTHKEMLLPGASHADAHLSYPSPSSVAVRDVESVHASSSATHETAVPPRMSFSNATLASVVSGTPSMRRASLTPIAPLTPAPTGYAYVRREHLPELPDEMAVEVGETVRVLKEFDDGWALCMNVRGEQGVVPIGCLQRGHTRVHTSHT